MTLSGFLTNASLQQNWYLLPVKKSNQKVLYLNRLPGYLLHKFIVSSGFLAIPNF